MRCADERRNLKDDPGEGCECFRVVCLSEVVLVILGFDEFGFL